MKMKHMPKTPMTEVEIKDQCKFVSKVLDEGFVPEEDEEFLSRRHMNISPEFYNRAD